LSKIADRKLSCVLTFGRAWKIVRLHFMHTHDKAVDDVSGA
jgi:hypothetical protein